MRKTHLLEVPHRQVVFVIPKMLRVFFKLKRKPLGDLCLCAVRSLLRYFQAVAGTALEPGIVAVILTFGDRINFHPHLNYLVTEDGTDETGAAPVTGAGLTSRFDALLCGLTCLGVRRQSQKTSFLAGPVLG